MEATFYEDSARYDEAVSSRAALKRPATLDLGGRSSSKKPRMNTLLTSPDLHMLKLESPELEKLIMQQHAPPPQQCMYPREREDFPDALGAPGGFANLYHPDAASMLNLPTSTTTHNNNGAPPSSMVDNPYGYHHHQQQQHHHPQQPLSNGCTTANLPMVSSSSSANCYPSTNGYNGYHPNHHHPSVVSVKEEPQTVPCASPHLGAAPRSPIDMEDQERLKLERKRLRNCIAASKCRRRKLERIARLEDRVALLKGENAELASHVQRLKEHVCRLKEQVLEHVRHGCEILVAPYAPQDAL